MGAVWCSFIHTHLEGKGIYTSLLELVGKNKSLFLFWLAVCFWFSFMYLKLICKDVRSCFY